MAKEYRSHADIAFEQKINLKDLIARLKKHPRAHEDDNKAVIKIFEIIMSIRSEITSVADIARTGVVNENTIAFLDSLNHATRTDAISNVAIELTVESAHHYVKNALCGEPDQLSREEFATFVREMIATLTPQELRDFTLNDESFLYAIEEGLGNQLRSKWDAVENEEPN